MSESRLVVIKVGGSLLDLPELGTRLDQLLSRHPDVRPLLVAGGGAVVETIRGWDRLWSLGEETSHDLAMEALTVTAALLTRIVPLCKIVRTRSAAEECWQRGERPVLRPADWLRDFESQHPAPPHTWEVTSDSLAACVAANWQADELWLLKSAELPRGISAVEASRSGLADRWFAKAAGSVPRICWCNLRSSTEELVALAE